MRIRRFALALVALTLACGGNGEPAADTELPADVVAEDGGAVAAMQAISDYWETHYNLGHPSMVASKMQEDGLLWSGNGSMMFGRPAVEASLAAQIEGSGAQVQIEQDEALAFGEFGMARGTYEIAGNADGQDFTNTGYWMSLATNAEGEWQVVGLVTNLDSPDQPILPSESMELPEVLESASVLSDPANYYMTHFNLGHPSMVADRYTENAVTMGSGESMISGRDAILARLTGMTDAGAQVSITPWATQELNGGAWVAGVGTYTIAVPDQETVNGHFQALYQAVDGEMQMHWLLTGAAPAG
jgi:ketosteroid isomerase-like protein